MKRSMMDILACPIDKTHPLELYEIKEKDEVISEGALVCTKCSRFYPIIEEIPIMLPDELRDKKLEIDFLKKNKENLPEKIVKTGLPWHL
ncbi:MAG: Trm112 family protein [Nitrososphaeria archaeon]|nr:Trm112 family protein [Nitrosopumilaceae archaeon]NIP09318.1 Trm112 family protein [Nitrosopumilaceae archaeon]NIP91191.1 Trm112 family protein [Nitrososphaeria archaeon]NIS94485.1 Trm112 family protein [Nitrosopumilaceae archaeon]